MNAVEILALAKAIVALGTPPPSSATRGLSRITLEIPANGEMPVNLEGDYVFLHSITTNYEDGGGSIEVKPEGGVSMVISEPLEGRIFPVPFRKISIKNLTAAYAMTAEISVGFGRVQHDGGADVQTVGGRKAVVAETLTRPANTTVYAAGDVVGNGDYGSSAMYIADCARVFGGSGTVTKVRLVKNTTTTANASFRLYLFESQPSGFPADNAQLSATFADLQGACAVIDLPAFVVDGASAAAFCEVGSLAADFKCGYNTRYLWGILVATAAYAPASGEQFELKLWIEQD